MKLFNLDDYRVTSVELKKYIDNKINELSTVYECDSFLNFPAVGNNKTLYIDTNENVIYRFSEEGLKYYSIVSDWNNIRKIDGSF